MLPDVLTFSHAGSRKMTPREILNVLNNLNNLNNYFPGNCSLQRHRDLPGCVRQEMPPLSIKPCIFPEYDPP
jgi:hypothetical protein